MIKSLFTAVLLSVCLSAAAQDSLQILNASRLHIEHTGMTVLGGWAAVNIAGGTVGYYNSGGSTRYFHQMNIIWNVVNLGAATLGYLNSRADSRHQLTAEESIKAQQKLERTFMINAVLDVAYIGAGAVLHHQGDHINADRQRGYGASIILQGAFLLLFDGTMYAAEKHNGNKLLSFLTKNQLIFNGRQVGMLISL